LLNEDWDSARELILTASPGFADSAQWAGLISDSMGNACTMAQVFIKTGDEGKAKQLIDDVIAHHDSVKSLIEHAYRIAPVECWLLQGEFDKALESLETRVAHNHYSDWWLASKLPGWEPLRAEPRFQAAVQAIETAVAEQRRLLAEMNLETDA
jgi:hypothetical protein